MLVQVAIALIALTAFSMLVFDYGVLWVSRGQAQNSADAGALAGAVSLAYVAPGNLDRARADAAAAAQRNRVWGEAPTVDPDTDVAFITCPPGAPGLPDTCIRVDTYRGAPGRAGGVRGTVLPTFFGQFVGVTQQGVRATATAQVAVGSQVTCLKPWAIPDTWLERRTPAEEYNRYVEHGVHAGDLLPDPRDVYIPRGGAPVDGFTQPTGYDPIGHPEQIGMQVTLKMGNPAQALQPGWFFPIDLPLEGGPETGGERYRENIAACNSMPVEIGDALVTEPGNMIGPTSQGMEDLIAQDPDAEWVDGEGIVNSCCPRSPRWVPIPLFSPEEYATQDRSTGRFTVTVIDILGFFIEGMQGNDVIGRLTLYPATASGGTGTGTPPSSFLRVVLLVR